jgi:hypothetical protein
LTQCRPPPLAERLGPTACPAASPVLHATTAPLSRRHVPSARDATHPFTGPPLLRPVTSTTALRRRSPPPRPRLARLHNASHHTARSRPRSTPDFSRSRPRHGPSAEGRREDFSFPQTDLPAPIRGPVRLPTSPRTAPAEPPCLPSLQAPPPPTTIVGRRPTPRSRFYKRFRSKVSTGSRSPRFPLRFPFSPAAANPRGAGAHRRPKATPASSVLDRERGEEEEGRFAHTPLPFPISPPGPPPLYSLSLLLSNQTLSL